MHIIRMSCPHTLTREEAWRRVVDLFTKFELLTQAQMYIEDTPAFVLRGPNIRGSLHVHEDRIDLELRLGVALSIVGERMRDIVEQELLAVCRAPRQ